MIVSPSFLSCNFDILEEEVRSISTSPWLHFDVMDGHFVPTVTYNHTTLQRLKMVSSQFFDCHLMIEQPEKYVADYINAGANLVTFHYEAVQSPIEMVIERIRSFGCKVGLSVKPATDITLLSPYLSELDLVLVMSVEPGKGGQKFIPESIAKIAWLAAERQRRNLAFLIEVDGGINRNTASLVKSAGADVVVAGSFVFSSHDRREAILVLEHA
jgi:ribulose-phosphate 3-epimerase